MYSSKIVNDPIYGFINLPGKGSLKIIEHLNESRKEARENFISRIGN
jgi:hypothetical protein